MPKWVQKLVEEEKAVTKHNEELAKQLGVEFPVSRYPGMGADRIRKRKVPLSREFKFKMDFA